MKLLQIFFFFGCWLLPAKPFAQSPKVVEADICGSFKRINYWSKYQTDHQDKADSVVRYQDSLEHANQVFGRKLKDYTEKFSYTLHLKFDAIRDQIKIVTSTDGLFRIYSWDTWLGGTEHDFENVIQYSSGKGTRSILNEDTTNTSDEGFVYYYSAIYTFKTSNKTYYLGVYNGIFSSLNYSQGVQIFSIDRGILNRDKIIRTKTGLHDHLEYDASLRFKVQPEAHFDLASKTIFIPVVIDNNKITRKYIRYQFNGKYFEKVK